ncbi:MAG TPA: DUF1428 family protein [Rhizomicrobium sp.]|nr:DUF1428 family protein [Rhizomicrobium sp.]
MYVAGLVIPVPADKLEAYRQWAENSAQFFKDYGCFTWQIWPDKAFFYKAEEKMHEDPRMDSAGEPPFDAKRLIAGCFAPIFSMGGD